MKNLIKSLLQNKKYSSSTFWILALLFTYLFLKPGFENNINLEFFTKIPPDKIVHFSIFFILTIFALTSFKTKNNTLIIISLIVYGALIEVVQHLMKVGRSAELSDFIADTLGVFVATIFHKKFIKKICADKY
ncbi:MAG: VanZ family protein [Flavobacteriales bacterium]|nr:VanZ family protein [Flavobacteriales bacterium]